MDILLDSGAFSAWNKGTPINLDGLIQYAKDNADVIDNIVALDVIPGSPGYKDIPDEEREDAAARGYDNYKYMLKKGLPKEKVIVVFHQGDNFYWLEKLRDEGVPYIGLSPANDRVTPEKMAWLDECMFYATDRNGLPLQKWHGFAVTSLPLMKRYPWYSVDSATWIRFAAYGEILFPRAGGERYDWLHDSPMSVSVSASPTAKSITEEGEHISNLSPEQQIKFREYLDFIHIPLGESVFDVVPKDIKLEKNQKWSGKATKDGMRKRETIVRKGAMNSWGARTRANAIFFANVEKAMPEWPWPYEVNRVRGLLSRGIKNTLTCPYSSSGRPIKIFLAGNTHEHMIVERFLKNQGYGDFYKRLVSYAYLPDCEIMFEQKRQSLAKGDSDGNLS